MYVSSPFLRAAFTGMSSEDPISLNIDDGPTTETEQKNGRNTATKPE